MKAVYFAIGCVCCATCGILAVFMIVTLLDEWLTPWDRRGKG